MPTLGINLPNMGTPSRRAPTARHPGVREAPVRYKTTADQPRGLADALFTTTQQRVLGALYGQPQRSFTVSELITSTGAGSGAVQRELAKLVASGLLTVRPIGNQKHYQANPAAPIHGELVGILQKTVGLAEPLRAALRPLSKKIVAAFVYGSVAKRSNTASSDIDVMVVSAKLGYADALVALAEVEEKLGRKINPTIFSPAELAKRIKSDNAFVSRVLEQPKIWLIGGEDDLRA
ncbi:MAG TPA: MarR family transcriptional regulator [Rhodanobacteraceae bacterium]|jgi:predicted nucleotidyltransferase|nr:MarR family transcriptional regulator [Rhodanobacteraceae bacterium]